MPRRLVSLIEKGYGPVEMLELCRKAQDAGMKLSVTAVLDLAGRDPSRSARVPACTEEYD